MPEGLIQQIQQDAAVRVVFGAIPGRTLRGVVTEVGVAATGTTFLVTVALAEGEGEVRPGMAAEVTFEFPDDGRGARFVVPPEAVGEDRQGRFVFVAEPSGEGLAVVQRRAVTVGEFVPCHHGGCEPSSGWRGCPPDLDDGGLIDGHHTSRDRTEAGSPGSCSWSF